MKRTRNKKGQFNYKYQGSKEFIGKLIREGKKDSEIMGLALQRFEGMSPSTIVWYLHRLRKLPIDPANGGVLK